MSNNIVIIVFAIRDAVVDDYVVSSPSNISGEPELGQYRVVFSKSRATFNNVCRLQDISEERAWISRIKLNSFMIMSLLNISVPGIPSAQQHVVRLPVSFRLSTLNSARVFTGIPYRGS